VKAMAKETILVVDDERRIRDLLNDILKLYGYKVITAAFLGSLIFD
jgi:DNA-binding NtrC family response regulator